ncbi:MAG: hypothetical protein ACO3NJ_03735 [Candidatus Poseidoniaceae archaeon]
MKTMTKEFGNLVVNKVGPVFTPDYSISAGGWKQPTPAAGIFINRAYFDLAGLSMDDLTLFFEGAAVQDVLPPSTLTATAGNQAFVVDIMSSKQLSDAEASATVLSGNFATSNLTFDQTMYMRVRFFNTDLDNQAGSYMIPVADNQLGSLSPTASDRIYCTRVVLFGGADGKYDMYPARYILRATAKEEPEFEYLMRLKRSYELQNEPDRD